MDTEKNPDLLLANYDYDLPTELVADFPSPLRDGSKLMIYQKSTGIVSHKMFRDLLSYLPPKSTLVFNRSKVFPCRLRGFKSSGGLAEIFFLSLKAEAGLYEVMLKAGGKRKTGEMFMFGELKVSLRQIGEGGSFWVSLNLSHEHFEAYLEREGMIPIPPYIREGKSQDVDKDRYQTVYAQEKGSVAAPTAGLHFTPELLEHLKAAGHSIAFVTLHVGLGTFRPVKSENILEHTMHEEVFFVSPEDARLIRAGKGNLIAIGTTSLRVLESCYHQGEFAFPDDESRTAIFLHPGKEIQSVQGLVTNFHLPKSSLLMLVSCLLGREKTLELYRIAIEQRYRFFSYGDAMLLLKGK